MLKKILLLLIFVGCLGYFTGIFFSKYFLNEVIHTSNNKIEFEIKKGQSLNSVLNQLKGQSPSLNFRSSFIKIWTRLKGVHKNIKPGFYEIKPNQSLNAFFKMIQTGQTILIKVTVPEGKNMYEVAEILESAELGKKNEFLKIMKDSEWIKKTLGEPAYTIEGYLFPDTYHFQKSKTPKVYLETMVNQFLTVFNEVKSQNTKSWPREDLVILASIIEKETGAAFERPEISSVFHNRLNKRMRLETDPTVLYGILDLTGTMKKNITRKDLRAPNEFNTYTIFGLPKGPIANPGKEALLAAMKPNSSKNLFFVSKNNGTHVFTTNYKDHLKAVQNYQINAKARKGKSWRDLKQ